MTRFYPLVRVFGALLMGFALCLAVPMGLSWYLGDGAHSAFDEAFLLTLATGAGLYFAARREKRELKVRDGFLLVVAIWTLLPVFAAMVIMLRFRQGRRTPA